MCRVPSTPHMSLAGRGQTTHGECAAWCYTAEVFWRLLCESQGEEGGKRGRHWGQTMSLKILS